VVVKSLSVSTFCLNFIYVAEYGRARKGECFTKGESRGSEVVTVMSQFLFHLIARLIRAQKEYKWQCFFVATASSIIEKSSSRMRELALSRQVRSNNKLFSQFAQHHGRVNSKIDCEQSLFCSKIREGRTQTSERRGAAKPRAASCALLVRLRFSLGDLREKERLLVV